MLFIQYTINGSCRTVTILEIVGVEGAAVKGGIAVEVVTIRLKTDDQRPTTKWKWLR